MNAMTDSCWQSCLACGIRAPFKEKSGGHAPLGVTSGTRVRMSSSNTYALRNADAVGSAPSTTRQANLISQIIAMARLMRVARSHDEGTNPHCR